MEYFLFSLCHFNRFHWYISLQHLHRFIHSIHIFPLLSDIFLWLCCCCCCFLFSFSIVGCVYLVLFVRFFSHSTFECLKNPLYECLLLWKTILWAYKAYCVRVCERMRMRMPVCMWFGCFLNGIMRNEYEIVYYIVNQIYLGSYSNRLSFVRVCFYTFQGFFLEITHKHATHIQMKWKTIIKLSNNYISFEDLHFIWTNFTEQFHQQERKLCEINCLFMGITYAWFQAV